MRFQPFTPSILEARSRPTTCNMNNGATDCTVGPSQTQYSDLACPP
jgi:hypothetical protein